MFASRERYVGLDLHKVIEARSRKCDIFYKSFSIQGERETRRRITRSDRSKHCVITGFLHIHRVFEPFAFFVIADHIARSLLVNVNARTFAVVGFATVFGIVFAIRLVALARTRNVKVFGFDFARDFSDLATKRFARYRICRSATAHECHNAVLVA